jgi:hypothetical protein
LVKAEPQPSQKFGETVCSAGLTADGQWRRLFPIRYRALPPEKRFNRWDWVEYSAKRPSNDHRVESRHVWEDLLSIHGQLRPQDRARLVERSLRSSVAAATARGESLCVIRPDRGKFRFVHKPKTAVEIEAERSKSGRRLSQVSMLEDPLTPIQPCPFHFMAIFDAGGASHRCGCGDWETDAMYWRFEKSLGQAAALERMLHTFNVEYPNQGMAIAMGTMAKRPQTWTLLGIIRAAEVQPELF